MVRAIASVTRNGYKHVIKPVLFTQHPDVVHRRLVAVARAIGAVPGARVLPRVWAYHNAAYLQQTVAGMVFKNPVGLSAGFDKGVETPAVMRSVGFGFMTGGSVTWGAYGGNAGDWFYRLPNTESIVVNAGLPSEGTETVAGRTAAYPASLFRSFPLFVSVAKTNSKRCASIAAGIQDYARSLAMFDAEPNVGALEINISCPNAFGGEDFTTPERLEQLLQVVDALALTKPVFIKMPISVPQKRFLALTDTADAHNIAGLTIGNLRKDRHNVVLKDKLPERVEGNLSGAPNRDISTKLIRETYRRHPGRFVLVGVGGVFTAEHAYEKIRAGANLIGLVTGVIFEGPQVVGEINRGLVALLKRDGLTCISDAVGLDAGA